MIGTIQNYFWMGKSWTRNHHRKLKTIHQPDLVGGTLVVVHRRAPLLSAWNSTGKNLQRWYIGNFIFATSLSYRKLILRWLWLPPTIGRNLLIQENCYYEIYGRKSGRTCPAGQSQKRSCEDLENERENPGSVI